MPFITEEIYQNHFSKNEKEKSIHLSKWPKKFNIKEGKDDQRIFEEILEFNSTIWKKKKESGLSLKAEISEIKIPKNLDKFKKDLITTHNIK